MENRAHAIAAGLFVLGLILAAVFAGSYLAGDRTARTTYRVISAYPVSGLNVQGQVRFRGISVGRVAKINLDPRDSSRIFVDVEIDSKYRLTKGTYAQLGMEGITGIAYVHLLDDGGNKDLLAEGPGVFAEITMRRSDLDELFDFAKLIGKDGSKMIDEVRDLLQKNRDNLTAAVANVNTLTAELGKTSAKLPDTISRVDRVLSDQNQRNVRDTLSSIRSVSRNLEDRVPTLATKAEGIADDFRDLSRRTGPLADEARELAGDLRNDTVPRAQAVADSLERNVERVGRLAYEIEKKPDSVLWGRAPVRPGPGEKGFE